MTLYLIGRMAGRMIAISADQVESVVDIGAVVPVPGTATPVRGLAALRSRVVTVISSRLVLGAPVAGLTPGRAVVTVVDGHEYAILLDALEDAAHLEVSALPSGLPITGAWRAIARGVITGDRERGVEPTLAVELRGLVDSLSLAA